MTQAYVALGSNLGTPLEQLRRAVIALEALPWTHIEKASGIYRSPAVGPGEQPEYLNAVVLLETELAAMDLLDALQQIERDQGRVRDLHWGPRTLDLDLLLYGDLTVNSSRLTIPHPRMHQRHFVLFPLHEICAPGLVLPDGSAIDSLLRRCPADGLVKTGHRLLVQTCVESGT